MPVPQKATTRPTAPLHALVFDSDAEYADIFVDLLSFVGEGPETWATTSPTEARRRATRSSYDVIVVARESGDAHLLIDIRRHQPDAVLVVTTAQELSPREISRLFAAGADDVIAKPFHPSVFAACINRRVLVRAQLQQGATAGLVPA